MQQAMPTPTTRTYSRRALYAEKLKEHKAVCDEEAEKVKAVGGLFILGTERHESRRIDNQLRGRAGRQGDPGESRFYIALTDDVMRLFGSERMSNMMESLGVDEDTPLDHKMLSNAIEQAQKTVESRNFQTRKSVLEYDDVMNQQRNIIYDERRKVLDGEDLRENINKMIYDFIAGSVNDALHGGAAENAEHLAEVTAPFEKLFLPKGAIKTEDFKGAAKAQDIIERVYDIAQQVYDKREAEFGLTPDGQPVMREIERVVMLRVVDEYWMDHIDAMAEPQARHRSARLRQRQAHRRIQARGLRYVRGDDKRHPRGDRKKNLHHPRPQGADA